MDHIDQIKEFICQIGTNAIASFILGLIILIVGLRLSRWIIKLISRTSGIRHMDASLQTFVRSITKIVLYALVISSAAICWGVPTTSFVTIFTSAGVTVGLALQGALSNFAGGLLILFFKPFQVGDYVENGAVSGTVKAITVIYTVIVTPDNKTITIPNGSLTNSNITNHSTQDKRRVDLAVTVSSETDIEQVRSLLLSVAERHESVLKDPAPLVKLYKQSAKSLDLIFTVWCKSKDREIVYGLMEQVKKACDGQGMPIESLQIDTSMKL